MNKQGQTTCVIQEINGTNDILLQKQHFKQMKKICLTLTSCVKQC